MKLIDWHKKGVPDEILSPDLDFPPGPTEASVGNQSHASPPPPEKASGGRDHMNPPRPREASGNRSHMDAPSDYSAARKKLDELL